MKARTIAVVGLSDDPSRPSHQVSEYMQSAGYKIIPVNPNVDSVLGEKAYRSLSDIPADVRIDIVDVFRRSSDAAPVVEEGIRRGAGAFWLQLGVVNDDARRAAEAAGIPIIMNSCIAVVHRRLREARR